MLEHLHLKNVGPAPEMEMALAPRLNLITGDNGLDKSFLLDMAWWALTRTWPRDLNGRLTCGYPARPRDRTKPASVSFRLTRWTKRKKPYESQYSPRDEAWVGPARRPLNPGLVLYAHADGGFSVWDTARNYWTTRDGVDVFEHLRGYVFSLNDVWDGLTVKVEGKETPVCNGLLRDWALWTFAGKKDAENMARLLAHLSPPRSPADRLVPGAPARLSLNDVRDIPSLRTVHDGDVPVLRASAGARRVVALAYILLWSWNEHLRAAELLGEAPTRELVLLVDEPESHLHPQWQESILGQLLELGRALEQDLAVQLVGATHAPIVLRSAEAIFEPDRDAWFDLELDAASSAVRLKRRDVVRRDTSVC